MTSDVKEIVLIILEEKLEYMLNHLFEYFEEEILAMEHVINEIKKEETIG